MKKYDLAKIAASGQCFRMYPVENKPGVFSVIAYGKYVELITDPLGQSLYIVGEHDRSDKEFWKWYFDEMTDYDKIAALADPQDEFLQNAIEYGAGIRILRQEPWEMLVTWQISPCNTIKNITAAVENLCRTYGEKAVSKDGVEYYQFPTPDKLTDAEGLRKCKVGFRAERIAKMAQNVVDGKIDINHLFNTNSVEVHNYLTSIEGIGDKVASCIQLFGLHDLSAFPVDTWIDKVIKVKYGGKFPIERYQPAAGVIQQYIYYYGRTLPELQGGKDNEKVRNKKSY